VQSADDAIFTREHIKYWSGDFVHDDESGISYIHTSEGDVKPIHVFAGVDPATDSTRRDSDFSVILFVGVCPDNNIYILEYIRKRSLPVLGIPGEGRKGIVDYIFKYNRIYHPNLFTIEETSMSRPIFQAMVAEMRRKNDFSVKYTAEKPGTRMSKRDRIQEILAQRFAIRSVHLRKDMYDLQQEVITFGPRMGHDDTIDALAYACKYAHPPKGIMENKDGTFYKNTPRAKSWVTA